MTTGLERVFRPISLKGYEGLPLYREVFMHYIHFLSPTDNTVLKSKLDKMIEGKLYKEARGDERSLYGECEYTFPSGETKRLVALGTDMNGNPMIPGVVRGEPIVPDKH